ncbi:MAG: TetR/AcrR family transcriptional regulator [Nannocystis sp.]|nr:TetR/AcrR family transcriptional regulator [Nannocystis sp.]
MPKPTFHNLPEPKRRRLIDAAIGEFAAHPYPEASLDRIAARAKVSKGSLYQYFHDKADLYRHLVLDELGARKQAGAPRLGGTFFERLEALFLAGLAAFSADPRAAALGARIYEDGGDPATRALKSEARERGVAYFRAELEAARGRGEVRADLDLDISARLVATLAGAGLVDLLSARLGKSLAQLARRRAPIDDQLVRETVHAAVELLAGGLRPAQAAAVAAPSEPVAPSPRRPSTRPPPRRAAR